MYVCIHTYYRHSNWMHDSDVYVHTNNIHTYVYMKTDALGGMPYMCGIKLVADLYHTLNQVFVIYT